MTRRFNRSVEARILRVNHGGESGAIRIYQAQILMAGVRCPELLPFLKEALAHEREHQAAFLRLMPGRAAKPCRITGIWAVGGAALGAFTGVLGRRAVLICTEAVERTVHRHLDDQIAWLDGRDPEMAETIRRIQQEEARHLEFALRGRGEKGPLWRLLDRVITIATEVLIWLSTRGDSRRLVREIAGRRRGGPL